MLLHLNLLTFDCRTCTNLSETLPIRKEVLRGVRRKLAEAGGGASLRLVGGALISIDSGGGLAENETRE
uniref:Uncharacterized protein n=1 Tax=Arundo donax TaxID=35708 RepID=A0A0A9E850_ARUDO